MRGSMKATLKESQKWLLDHNPDKLSDAFGATKEGKKRVLGAYESFKVLYELGLGGLLSPGTFSPKDFIGIPIHPAIALSRITALRDSAIASLNQTSHLSPEDQRTARLHVDRIVALKLAHHNKAAIAVGDVIVAPKAIDGATSTFSLGKADQYGGLVAASNVADEHCRIQYSSLFDIWGISAIDPRRHILRRRGTVIEPVKTLTSIRPSEVWILGIDLATCSESLTTLLSRAKEKQIPMITGMPHPNFLVLTPYDDN